jgi:hypothetical protein
MVKGGGGAGGLVVDTTVVELERRVRSINGNGHRGNNTSGQQGALRSRWDIVEAGKSGTNVGSLEFALVRASGGVRVRRFSVNSRVGDDVLESLIHETSVATLVSLGSGAIYEILFGERDEVVLGQEPSSFGGTSGRERPARSALSLILNGSDGTSGSPIKIGWGIDSYFFNSFVELGDVHAVSGVGKLFESLIGKFI